MRLCVARWRGDWLAQILWSISNNLEPPSPLPSSAPTPYDPSSAGRILPDTGLLDPDQPAFPPMPGPICYELYIPPEPRIGYHFGEHHQLTPPQIRGVFHALQRDYREWDAWLEYIEGGNHPVFRYWPSSGRMRTTSYARSRPHLRAVVTHLSVLVAPVGPAVCEIKGKPVLN